MGTHQHRWRAKWVANALLPRTEELLIEIPVNSHLAASIWNVDFWEVFSTLIGFDRFDGLQQLLTVDSGSSSIVSRSSSIARRPIKDIRCLYWRLVQMFVHYSAKSRQSPWVASIKHASTKMNWNERETMLSISFYLKVEKYETKGESPFELRKCKDNIFGEEIN